MGTGLNTGMIEGWTGQSPRTAGTRESLEQAKQKIVSTLYSNKGFLRVSSLSHRNFIRGVDRVLFGINRKLRDWEKISYLTVLASRRPSVSFSTIRIGLEMVQNGSDLKQL